MEYRTREQLLQDIEELPTFELTPAYTKKDGEYLEQTQKAVVETGHSTAYAYVSPRYHILQFNEIFRPVIENVQECEGKIHSYGGFARLVMFPKIGEFEDKWGIIAQNSVDKTSSVIIKFCVKHDGRSITLPDNIAGYVRNHSGASAVNVKEFVEVIAKVKDQWRTIVEKFGQYVITQDNLNDVMSNIGIQEKGFIKDTLVVVQGNVNYTLWELFMDLIDHITEKSYKSDIHRDKKMDKICEAIINYCILLKI